MPHDSLDLEVPGEFGGRLFVWSPLQGMWFCLIRTTRPGWEEALEGIAVALQTFGGLMAFSNFGTLDVEKVAAEVERLEPPCDATFVRPKACD